MTTYRTKQPTAAEVRKEVEEIVPTMSTTHHFTSWDVYHLLIKRLHINETGPDINLDLVYNQGRQALDLISRRGTLIKFGKGIKHPDGISKGTDYYRPEALEAAKERARVAAEEARQIRERWERAYDDLDRLAHVLPTTKRGEPIVLSLEQHEKLGASIRHWSLFR